MMETSGNAFTVITEVLSVFVFTQWLPVVSAASKVYVPASVTGREEELPTVAPDFFHV